MLDKNIFVHHLDAELQKLFIIRVGNYNPSDVYEFLSLATRIAFLLAKEKILIPISNYLESDEAFKIVNFFSPLVGTACVELLSTSSTITELINKKQIEHGDNFYNPCYHYADYEKGASGIYLPGTLAKRKLSSSQLIKNDWISNINGSKEYWSSLFDTMPDNMKFTTFEKTLDEIPRQLGGRAYISDYIVPLLNVDKGREAEANRIVNLIVTRSYIRGYLEEYNAVCLKDTPFIKSEDVLPMDKEHISYSKYHKLLNGTRYRESTALNYIATCSSKELYEFKNSNDWVNILTQPFNSSQKSFFIGGQAMDDKIKIGIITALPEEFAAIKVLLAPLRIPESIGGIRYYYGVIDTQFKISHTVVFCMLPDMGNNFASIVATKMLTAFPTIENLIICGIAGGVPSVTHLGDVVVSTKGVLQYDFGKNERERFTLKDEGKPCSHFLLDAIKYLKTEIIISGENWKKYIDEVNKNVNDDFSRPIINEEEYYEKCDNGNIVKKSREPSLTPNIHFERIASANVVQKNPVKRDALYVEKNVYAIEMEGAGIRDAAYLNNIGYVAIRGICDFCDDSKNDVWHNYAAAVAAAYTKALIESIPPFEN